MGEGDVGNPMSAIRRAWRAFARDQPGARFLHHYERAQRERSTAKTAVRLGVGAVSTLGGVALWFLPGPGTLLVMFGMAMLASESRVLARVLDRTELFVRSGYRRLRSWWRAASAT
jgi:hypothetical protein